MRLRDDDDDGNDSGGGLLFSLSIAVSNPLRQLSAHLRADEQRREPVLRDVGHARLSLERRGVELGHEPPREERREKREKRKERENLF